VKKKEIARVSDDPHPVTPPGGPTTVVASSNAGPDHRSLDQMASDVLALDADVLNILELTEADRSALHAAGITDRYPHFVEDARAGAHGSGIYSRYPLRDTGVLEIGGAPMAHATVDLPAGPATVIAVHTTQPLAGPGHLDAELEQLREAISHMDGPVILAGDFNATRQHQALRELLETGFTDAHLTTGRGWAATWPVGRRLPPAAVRVDRPRAGVARPRGRVGGRGGDLRLRPSRRRRHHRTEGAVTRSRPSDPLARRSASPSAEHAAPHLHRYRT
jgi:hypothetical protein